jgi:hypothetical protein
MVGGKRSDHRFVALRSKRVQVQLGDRQFVKRPEG